MAARMPWGVSVELTSSIKAVQRYEIFGVICPYRGPVCRPPAGAYRLSDAAFCSA